jgi:hypothetical protein
LVEVLERGFQSFPCEQGAIPYQEESQQPIPPVVGWALFAVLHRIWPLRIAMVLGVVALFAWRLRAGRQ